MRPIQPFKVVEYRDEKGVNLFRGWLTGIRDKASRAIIQRRIARLEVGLLGDCKNIGDGVFELRIDYGPGYRVYFGFDEEAIVILISGGTKRHQSDDIMRAKRHWKIYRSLK